MSGTHPRPDEHPDDLLTPLAYALSLAPPRAPPFESPHRALLTGQDPSTTVSRLCWPTQRTNHTHHKTNNSWVQNILNRAHRRRSQLATKKQHPHLKDQPRCLCVMVGQAIYRIDMEQIARRRMVRWIADTLVLLGIPALVVTSPRATLQFISLSRQVQPIRYGTHNMQLIDLYLKNPKSDNLIIFVHGGAWGSGLPWMYRLVAQDSNKTWQ